MPRKNQLILFTLLIALSSAELPAKGVKLTLHLQNGKTQHGELYSVSDSALIVGMSAAGQDRFAEIKFF